MPDAVMEEGGTARPRRDETINLRVTRSDRALIDTAAEMVGKTRTEFVVDSAKQSAIEVLFDQRLFALPDDQWSAFNEALDNPPLPNDQLKQLMARKAPWET